MQVTMDFLNLKQTHELSQICADMIMDERIPEEIRMEYAVRIDSIEWESNSNE